MKTIRDIAIGAILALTAGAAVQAFAVTGIVPQDGPQLIDGTYVRSIARGINFTHTNNLTATGTNAATGLALSSNVMVTSVGTVASGTGVVVPYAVESRLFTIANNGANTLTIYANPNTNPVTGGTDTINGGASVTLAAGKSILCFVAKSGTVSCVVSA